MNDSIQKKVFHSVYSLHDWRKKFNNDRIGYGFDQYAPNKKFDYAEAYALWGSAYLKLYKMTKKKEFLNCADKCREYLLKNYNKKYKNYSWGLPWEWNNIPKGFSYITTTTFVGNFILDYYEQTKDDKLIEICNKIGNWIIDENGHSLNGNFKTLNYSDHENLNYPVINAISMAGGFFARLNHYKKNTKFRNEALSCINYVTSNQNLDGSWTYSIKSKIIDNVHTAFTIDGLINFYKFSSNNQKKLEHILSKACEFYINNLFSENGYAYEKVETKLNRIIRFKMGLIKNDARVHAIGAGIKSLSKINYYTEISCPIEQIIDSLLNNMFDGIDAFSFTKNIKKYYIRNEAHVIDGLSNYLLFYQMEDRN